MTGMPGWYGHEEWQMGDHLKPVVLGPGRTAVALSAGNVHTCAIVEAADVHGLRALCW